MKYESKWKLLSNTKSETIVQPPCCFLFLFVFFFFSFNEICMVAFLSFSFSLIKGNLKPAGFSPDLECGYGMNQWLSPKHVNCWCLMNHVLLRSIVKRFVKWNKTKKKFEVKDDSDGKAWGNRWQWCKNFGWKTAMMKKLKAKDSEDVKVRVKDS